MVQYDTHVIVCKQIKCVVKFLIQGQMDFLILLLLQAMASLILLASPEPGRKFDLHRIKEGT